MDYKKQHPLSQITNGNSLSMLEMLIPYVDYPFKLPLALFIKFNEIRMLIRAFDDYAFIERIGLHNDATHPMEMLSSLTGIPAELLQSMMSLSESGGLQNGSPFPFPIPGMGDFAGSGIPFSHPPDPGPDPAPPMMDFDNRIDQLFAEYDEQNKKENIDGIS